MAETKRVTFADYEFRRAWRPGMRTSYVPSSLPFLLFEQVVEMLHGREMRWTRAPGDGFFRLTRVIRKPDGSLSHGGGHRSWFPDWVHRVAFALWEPTDRAWIGLRARLAGRRR